MHFMAYGLEARCWTFFVPGTGVIPASAPSPESSRSLAAESSLESAPGEPWFMVHGSWFMGYGSWFMVYGLWFMVYDLCFVVHGSW